MSRTQLDNDGDLVLAQHFLLATRDTGYRTPAYALAELVDNAIQAEATNVEIGVSAEGGADHPIGILVADNGTGIPLEDLQAALAFGGTTRFNDRASLGRYGMGLPNGAVSLAKRITLCSWTESGAFETSLDVGAIVAGRRRGIPHPSPTDPPPQASRFSTGTSVRLSACDRVPYRRAGSLASRLQKDLGRIFRSFIADGLDLRVNGEPVVAADPLFLETEALGCRARPFGSPLSYKVRGANGRQGEIRVRFAELPVHRWAPLTAAEKRAAGVSSGSCVSIMRAGREIDHGWFFMGGKRRENYDDWWRCEVAFDPVLDELFGITHAKQSIVPTSEVNEMLSTDLEAVARALNSRVRRAFKTLKHAAPLSQAEKKARKAHGSLRSLPNAKGGKRSGGAREAAAIADEFESDAEPYRVAVAPLSSTAVYEFVHRRGQLTLVLNEHHPFFRDLYEPLSALEDESDLHPASCLALAVLAMARTEASLDSSDGSSPMHSFRQAWSDTLATFFNA